MKGNPLLEFFLFGAFWMLLWIPLDALNRENPKDRLKTTGESNFNAKGIYLDGWIEVQSTEEIDKIKVLSGEAVVLFTDSETEDYHTFSFDMNPESELAPFTLSVDFKNQNSKLKALQFRFLIDSNQAWERSFWTHDQTFTSEISIPINPAVFAE